MNTHPSLEAQFLRARAAAVTKIRDSIRVPCTVAELPSLITASNQLRALAGVVLDQSHEVLVRAAEPAAGTDLRPFISAHASAAADTGRAVENFTEAYAQLAFLHRYAEARDTPDLRDARQAAFQVVQERLAIAREDLLEASRRLEVAVERITHPVPRAAAARSRTTRPAPEQAASDSPLTQSPRRLSSTSAPRHGR